MVSGIGPAVALAKHNIPIVTNRPGVGQNMQDHVLMGPSYRVNAITGFSLADAQFAIQTAEEFDTQHVGFLTSPGGDFGGWEKLPQGLRRTLSANSQKTLKALPADWPEIGFLSIGGYLGYQQG
ncbi:hypothetical protein AAFC00_005045 [Neodothiora populina]|uniref:Uncharacterized protein n=1 Tax=Neodothiora populina TaxID=2781224 RepID=A0ABR3PJL7_9PEZI